MAVICCFKCAANVFVSCVSPSGMSYMVVPKEILLSSMKLGGKRSPVLILPITLPQNPETTGVSFKFRTQKTSVPCTTALEICKYLTRRHCRGNYFVGKLDYVLMSPNSGIICIFLINYNYLHRPLASVRFCLAS